MSGTIMAAGFQFQNEIWQATVSIGDDFTGTIDAPDVGFGPLLPFEEFRSFPVVRIGRSLTTGSTINAGKYSATSFQGGIGAVVVANWLARAGPLGPLRLWR